MKERILPRRLPRNLSATVQRILADLPDVPPETRPSSSATDERPGVWSVHAARATETGLGVVMAGRSADPEVVVKVVTAGPVGAQLYRHWAAICALRADPRSGPWLRFVPTMLASGEVDGMFYVVERVITGVEATSMLSDAVRRAEIIELALSTITSLHHHTAATTVIDEATLNRWVTIPVEGLRRVGCSSRTLERIHSELREFLTGRAVGVSWIHGDYWPGNVLVGTDPLSLRGIVDWESAGDGELPAHDLFHFLLFTRRMVERSDLGLLVRDLLRGRASMAPERDQLEPYVPHDDPQWFRTALLLYWLRHLTSHLSQPGTTTNQWYWVRRNVNPVLRVA